MVVRIGSRLDSDNYRWNTGCEPEWSFSSTMYTAPALGTTLFSKEVTPGKVGKVLGYYISSDDINSFSIKYFATSGATTYTTHRVVFGGDGTEMQLFGTSLFDAYPTYNPTYASIKITTDFASKPGSVYHAGLLYAEEDY